jgi:hypothetical protein
VRSLRFYLLTPPLLALAAAAQTRPVTPAEPTGTITGHVFCADTNQPARFAHVSLEAIPDPTRKSAPVIKVTPINDRSADSVETTLDGSFTLTGVKPGAYYVIVEKNGYIKPRDMFTTKQLEDPSPDTRALVTAALPHVIVESGHTEQTEVRLERGAAISGTVLFDDGTPASEVSIDLLHKDASGKWTPIQTDSTSSSDRSTNDRGFFRIPSLLGDEYMIQADLRLTDTKSVSTGSGENTIQFAMATFRFSLPFYGSGTARQSQAQSIKLRAGQELTGQDMTIPISKLHKLTGRVAAGRDGHFVNAAKITLLTRDDNKELVSTDIEREDGLFHFDFIPTGDYILRITNARDVTWEPAPPDHSPSPFPFPKKDVEHTTATYGNVDQPLLFDGDTLGITATVPADTKPTPTPTASN